MNDTTLAYLAGVIDSDGYISIKRSTYGMRVRGDCGAPIYSERMGVKQVELPAVALLHATFGGYLGIAPPTAKKGRPLHTWYIHSAAAGRALALLRPYLRIKEAQADNALALRTLITTSRVRRWPVPPLLEGEPLITATAFAARLGIDRGVIYQAVGMGSVPSVLRGRSRLLPVSFLEAYRARVNRQGAKPPRSAAVTEQMEALYQRAKALNRVGT
jgi:hypothetical protein